MAMLRQILLFMMLLMALTSLDASAETLSNLHINSTDLIVDREKMTATFTGNVVLCFKDVTLLGKKVVFIFEDEQIRDIKTISVYDHVRAKQDDETVVLADEAMFEMEKSELKLIGNVVIEKDDKIMKAKEMIYYGKISNVMLHERK